MPYPDGMTTDQIDAMEGNNVPENDRGESLMLQSQAVTACANMLHEQGELAQSILKAMCATAKVVTKTSRDELEEPFADDLEIQIYELVAAMENMADQLYEAAVSESEYAGWINPPHYTEKEGRDELLRQLREAAEARHA
nr:hypothetical protein 36 [bacterium]